MAENRKSAPRSSDQTSHQDRDSLTSSAVADPHGVAFAERQRDPNRYDDPTVATPGVLDDIDEEVEDAGPQALIDADAPEINLDPSVDNRDQVQPMLDTLAEDAVENAAAQGNVTAAINAHESDAVDVEAQMEEQAAKRDERREALAASREEARSLPASGSDATTTTKTTPATGTTTAGTVKK